MPVKRKAVRVTLEESLLGAMDDIAFKSGETRSAFARAASRAELKRCQTEALEAAHRASYLETPDDDAWRPLTRARGDDSYRFRFIP